MLTSDRKTIHMRVLFLGIFGVIAATGAVVLVLAGYSVEGMSIFALATTVAGMIGGAPRSSDPQQPAAAQQALVSDAAVMTAVAAAFPPVPLEDQLQIVEDH